MLDIASEYRYAEASCEIAKLLRHPNITGKPLLVLANKNDHMGPFRRRKKQVFKDLKLAELLRNGPGIHLAQVVSDLKYSNSGLCYAMPHFCFSDMCCISD